MEIFGVYSNGEAIRQIGRISLDDFDLSRAQKVAGEMYPNEEDVTVEHLESRPSKRSVYKRLTR